MSLNINKTKIIPVLAMILVTLAFAEVTLISPPNNCYFYNPSPLFDWADVTGATQYRIQVDDTVDFASPIINATVDTSEYQNVSLLPETLYYWRVMVETPVGETSLVWQFYAQTKGPDLISPRPDTIIDDATPDFAWYELTGASLYRLVVTPSGSVTPAFDTIIADTIFTPTANLTLGDYSWFAEAQDSFGYWSEPAESWAFTIIAPPTPPVPVLIEPENLSSVSAMPVTLVWSSSEGAVIYNLVAGSLDINTPDTTYTADFPRGIITWQVRAQNEFEAWSDFSAEWTFSVLLPAWVEKESMPAGANPKKKNVKDGGSLVAVNNDIYALRGNKSRELYKYNGTAWTLPNELESMPFTYKPATTKLNKKEVGKGASLCYNGDSLLYATKGNGTNEFWAYNIYTDTWTLKSYVPATKGLKGGTSTAYLEGKVYMLVGGQKPAYMNFLSFNTANATWDTLDMAPLNTGKPYKDGSCIVLFNNEIYCLQAGANENYFSIYNIAADTWTAKEYMPLIHPNTPKKKTKVKDGATMTSDGNVIYAIKGGKVNEFWRYTPGTPGVWSGLESIPRRNVNPKYNKTSMPKTGASLACNSFGSVYLIKGNGTNEFWKYYPNQATLQERVVVNTNQSTQHNTNLIKITNDIQITPNPIINNSIVKYTVNNAGKVSIKLYHADGRLVTTLQDAHLNAGAHTCNLSTQTLAKGIYFLKLETKNGQTNTKLIVK